MALVLDTGPIVALLDAGDPEHERCVAMVAAIGEDLVIPVAVLIEVGYWLLTFYGPNRGRPSSKTSKTAHIGCTS